MSQRQFSPTRLAVGKHVSVQLKQKHEESFDDLRPSIAQGVSSKLSFVALFSLRILVRLKSGNRHIVLIFQAQNVLRSVNGSRTLALTKKIYRSIAGLGIVTAGILST